MLLSSHEIGALFVIAAAALSLLFTGIHNAWDTVTYVVVERGHWRPEAKEAAKGA